MAASATPRPPRHPPPLPATHNLVKKHTSPLQTNLPTRPHVHLHHPYHPHNSQKKKKISYKCPSASRAVGNVRSSRTLKGREPSALLALCAQHGERESGQVQICGKNVGLHPCSEVQLTLHLPTRRQTGTQLAAAAAATTDSGVNPELAVWRGPGPLIHQEKGYGTTGE